ncbi:Ankyrin repeats (3 copies) [Rubripirellula tenax]|uniref:Ankyrin repeats (3 copies) n=1 Tax=Rubripirellula tenax TaxID=2528015 RepID=A0A5C6E6Q1_9BACT|nr:ankyrin repeat domain-containing protein [Rubripirellula tenax]TWU44470.1 Ankyrin repeats (3 copies) [Rubripirellula tenax]
MPLTAIGIIGFQVATGPSLDRRLLRALKADRTLATKFYLLLGADPDEGHGVSSYDGNALHWAAFRGDDLDVKNLLEAGATVNCYEKDGFTPIVYAANKGHWEIVKMLVDTGADHRQTGADGQRVVDYAMEAGRQDIVKLLTSESFPSNYWTVETRVTALDTGDDGLPCNRLWQVYRTDLGSPDNRWAYSAGVRRFTSMKETDAEGNDQTIRGVTSIRIADDQNWIEVTFVDGTVTRMPL